MQSTSKVGGVMRFKCPGCKEIIKRDMRRVEAKIQLFRRGYRTYCDKISKTVYCKPVKG